MTTFKKMREKRGKIIQNKVTPEMLDEAANRLITESH
ncbi:hypothetical protein CWC47_01775 [Bacillus paranthracis]|nr:hypothetical protein [Bacillus paranthracis]BAL18176.1 conserved hypothetical protein [Bacillus cereus NC7401]